MREAPAPGSGAAQPGRRWARRRPRRVPVSRPRRRGSGRGCEAARIPGRNTMEIAMRIQMHSRLSRPSAPTLTRALMLTVVLAAALAAPASGQPGPLQGLDAYVEKAMSDWEIPGLAIAVVKDGETVWARGFGVRDLR